MVRKGASIAVLVLGLFVLISGLSMSDTQTITGSTEVPESCIDTEYIDDCYGGGTINSETTVDNPSKGPTIVGGLLLTGVGFVLTVASSGSDEEDGNDQSQSSGSVTSPVNADGGSSVDTTAAQEQQRAVENPPQQTQSEPQPSKTVTFIETYNDELKYYGSIVGGALVTYFFISFLFGPTFIMEGFIGRVVTILSWIGGGMLGRRFHERRYQEDTVE